MLSSNIGSVNKKNSRLIPVRNQSGVSYAPENRQLTVDKWFSSLSLLSQGKMGFFPKSKKDTYRFDKKVNDKMEKFIAGIQIENVAGTCFTAEFV